MEKGAGYPRKLKSHAGLRGVPKERAGTFRCTIVVKKATLCKMCFPVGSRSRTEPSPAGARVYFNSVPPAYARGDILTDAVPRLKSRSSFHFGKVGERRPVSHPLQEAQRVGHPLKGRTPAAHPSCDTKQLCWDREATAGTAWWRDCAG